MNITTAKDTARAKATGTDMEDIDTVTTAKAIKDTTAITSITASPSARKKPRRESSGKTTWSRSIE